MDDSSSGPSRRQGAKSTSGVLREILENTPDERFALGDLITMMGDRAYGVLLLIFAVPNVVPVALPGWSTLFGIPLMMFAWQLAAGHHRPWLPRWFAGRTMRRQDFEKVVTRFLPYLEQAERLLRPRWLFLTSWTTERIIGLVSLILAVVITLPIPLGNILPGLAVTILALALIERDGVAVALGLVLAVVSLAIVSIVLIAGFQAIVFFLRQAFA